MRLLLLYNSLFTYCNYKDLEGKGGEYLEDCHVARIVHTLDWSGGVAAHAYDNESARKLWEYSEKVVNA